MLGIFECSGTAPRGRASWPELSARQFPHIPVIRPEHGQTLKSTRHIYPVGSSAGAAARRLVLGLFPRFPSSCPFRICRGSVSNARHIARSVRISRTTRRSCTFRDKAYATYSTGATAESDCP
jgi:hypothetical protein